jgi:hypothetical protein
LAARAEADAAAASYAGAAERLEAETAARLRAEDAAQTERKARLDAASAVATARLEASEAAPAARAGGPSLPSAVGPDLPPTQSRAVAQADLTELVSRLAPVWAEAKGRTVAEAVATVLGQLGVTEDEAEIEVISEGSRWGHRGVRIRARIRIAGERPRSNGSLVGQTASRS